MSTRAFDGSPLTPGVNVDIVDVPAGCAFASGFGYVSGEHQMVVEYALRRWQRGEEDGAIKSLLSGGVNLTDAYAIIAAATAAETSERTSVMAEQVSGETRCPTCGVPNGSHGFVHNRHENGGGHNSPCPKGSEQRTVPDA